MASMESIELRSTWMDGEGRLWVVDHRAGPDSFSIRPAWAGAGHMQHEIEGARLRLFELIETERQAFERRERSRRRRCLEGQHEDPDHSGLCIHCGAVLDGS